MPETNARIKVCHDTAANFKTNNPTLLVGEWALETDTKKMKIGDGSTAYNALPYSTAEDSEEWQKPADWIDIRSGARNNSVYFLIAHATPVESEGVYTVLQYNKFACRVDVSNSGTYDVYIDGMKAQTNNSGSTFVLDWAALYTAGTVVGGFEVSYPSQFVTHVVRITPSLGTNKLTTVTTARPSGESANNYPLGVLWSHVSLDYAMTKFATGDSSPYYAICPIQVAVTANNNVIEANYCGFPKNSALRTVPVLKNGILVAEGLYSTTSLHTITVDNFRILSGAYNVADKRFINVLTPANETVNVGNVFSYNAALLKEFPEMNLTLKNAENFLNGYSGEPVSFDFSNSNECTKLGITNSSGVKAVTVSNEAPFDKTSSPQLSVAGCALSRAALVNLFKSMPYNVGYTVVGTPTIVDGILYPNNTAGNTTDFVKITDKFGTKDFFFHIKAKYSADLLNNSDAYTVWHSNRILIGVSRGSLRILIKEKNADSYNTLNFSPTLIQADTWYDIEFIRAGNVYTLRYKESSGSTWSELSDTFAAMDIASGDLNINFTNLGANIYGATIDLNETYIKVDGVTLFNGAATRELNSTVTKYGSPTISSAMIASGFSSANYFQGTDTVGIGADDSLEIGFRLLDTQGATGAIQDIINTFSDAIRIYIGSDQNKISGYYNKGDGSRIYLSYQSSNLTGFFKFARNGDTVTFSQSSDGDSWTTLWEREDGFASFSATTITLGVRGYQKTGPFGGKIDLNNFYIKKNGTVVMSGTQPMTKTCSVVGCTGTADLTADDKAIATGKGWELTVA